MDVGITRFKRDAGTSLSHVESVGHFEDTRLDGQAASFPLVGDDGVEHLGDDDGAFRNRVKSVEEVFRLEVRQEQAVVFVLIPMDGDAQIVRERGQDDDHLGVLVSHVVVLHDAHGDVGIVQQADHFQRQVGDDLDVHFTVITDAGAVHGVDVGALPEGVQFFVRVRPLHQGVEFGVMAGRQVQRHRISGFINREKRLVDEE